jgi:hypothetical protein
MGVALKTLTKMSGATVGVAVGVGVGVGVLTGNKNACSLPLEPKMYAAEPPTINPVMSAAQAKISGFTEQQMKAVEDAIKQQMKAAETTKKEEKSSAWKTAGKVVGGIAAVAGIAAGGYFAWKKYGSS